MSNFSFSHSVFKRLVSQGRQKVSLFGNGLKGANAKVRLQFEASLGCNCRSPRVENEFV